LQSIAEQATDQFSQFSSLQLRIFNVQPTVSNDMLEFVGRIISSAKLRLPALERSVQEIITEWQK
jgi:hypothetical protein